MTKKLYIKTYGCQMNVYDSKRMADVLKPMGYHWVDEPDDADFVILNTCHIREKAAEKVYSDIGRLRMMKEARMEAGGNDMMMAVAGCVAQAEGAEILRRQPVIDMVFGPQVAHRLPKLVERAEQQRLQRNTARVLDTDFPTESKFDHFPEEVSAEGPSAFLSIQEGCDKFCTYCVVPYTRGAEYSRPFAAVMEEATKLVAQGVVEITLLGQNVNAYHGDLPEGGTIGLGDLIRRLSKMEGLKRVRFTTSHPGDMEDDLIKAYGEDTALMPYLHLPVQSGSNRVLKAMNRQHTAESYLKSLDQLRAVNPDIALSGDFIVGFPGETEEDFQATLDLVKKVRYAQAYSFKYSPRPGTPAAGMEQIDEAVKAERLGRLQDLLNEHQLAFNEASVGKTMAVLLERPGRDKTQIAGRSPYMQSVFVNLSKGLDDPENEAYDSLMGRVVDVIITEAGANSLQGQLVNVGTGAGAKGQAA